MPLGIIALKLSKKLEEFEEEGLALIILSFKFLVILGAGVISLLFQLNDSQLIWLSAGLLLISLSVDFFIAVKPILGTLTVASLIVLTIVFAIVVGVCGGVNNAQAFDDLVIHSEGFPIQNEIPDDELRLTTKELAESIASQHMGEFGSSAEIISSDVGIINGTLYWIVAISKQEDFGLKRKTAGFIFIDANDPGKPVTTQQVVLKSSEGLDYNPILGALGSAQANCYFGIGTDMLYGEAYPVIDSNGVWSVAQTKFYLDMMSVRHYAGIYQIDENGAIINEYQSNFPSQMIKIYDEDNFLEAGISDWGNYRKEGGFDLFAGGCLWIPPSNDRLEITEDTRYIYDSDTKEIVAINMVNPIRDNGKLSLAGAFKTNSSGIYYYDLRDFNLMSGYSASSIVESKITARSGSTYSTAMELIYPIVINGETRYAWFVPIYYKSENTGLRGLAGLGIVDAQSPDKVAIVYTGDGSTGTELIHQAKEAFKSLYFDGTPYSSLEMINATLISMYDPYVKEGNTMRWIIINTELGINEALVDSSVLSNEQLLDIQKLQIGDSFELKINNNNIVERVAT